MVFTTKSTGVDRDYIVLKHTLRGVNYTVMGIRFRDSYAVVEKGSKTYRSLKSMPVLKKAEEYPITFLRKLSFITRPLDVKAVYGTDVYVQFLRELTVELEKESQEAKVQEEIEHVQESKLCAHRTQRSGGEDLCSESALEESPSGFCFRHILQDPKLVELGIEVPKFIPKAEKKAKRDEVIAELRKLKRASEKE